MNFILLVISFPEWLPHFSFLDTPQANEMMALRWLHLVFGIIWIGLLYFFNLVLTPAMKKCDPKLRIKIYPELMPGAMGWFRFVGAGDGDRGHPLLHDPSGRGCETCGRPFADWQVVWLVVSRMARRIRVYLRVAASGERDSQ